VVATDTQTYREAIEPGVTGYLALSTAEWVEGINALLGFRDSLRAGRAARALALRQYSPEAYKGVLAGRLARRAGAFSGEAPPQTALDTQPQGVSGLRELARNSLSMARSSIAAATEAPESSLQDPHGQLAALVHAEVLAPGNEVSQALVGPPRRGNVLLSNGEPCGTVLADLEHPISPAADAVVDPDSRGAFQTWRSTGNDAQFVLPITDGPRRVLVVELMVEPDGDAPFAQLFWHTPESQGFNEGKSLVFPLLPDGVTHTYVIDLQAQLGARWPQSGPLSVRFDPLPCPGRFRLERIALLAERPTDAVDLRRRLGERYLQGDGLEVGALQNPMPMPAAARVKYVDRLSLQELRAHYPELDGQPLVNPSVLAEADTLEPVETGSQDFVVTNHVLEHLRDPLGGMRAWLRVLKPGGYLLCAVPDQKNPYDARRAVTQFDHLMADRDRRELREAADQEHYVDWTRSAHPTMTPAEQAAFTEKISRERYDIHFHVFDSPLFQQVVRFACQENQAELVEFLTLNDEHFAVLKKTTLGVPAALAPRGVDVVVPIYNAREFTNACVQSVLEHATGDWRLVLVNDKSTDAALTADLRRYAQKSDRIVLLENEQNLGFVMTANRGMREANGRDVLLLNSDTEVFPGFLDRLRACAYADADTGILSPFSNNATVCSIPSWGQDNAIPEGFTVERWAELVSACSKRRRPELVTAVGFCMYVRAEVLEKVGLFDEVSYGRGFGEENDLCERAKKAGFKIRLADDVFVYHKGKASFGDEGRALEGTNGAVLEGKHPGYHAAVADYFRVNPLAPAHADIRLHLPRLRHGYEQAVLYVLHASPFDASPGGTEFHVRDMIRALKLPRVVIGYPEGTSLIAAEVLDGNIDSATFYRFPLTRRSEMFCVDNPEATGVLKRWVELFGIRSAHVHHLLHMPITLGRALREAGVRYAYTSHDFYAACPSWNLFDFGRRKSCDCKPGGEGCVDAARQTMGVALTRPADELRAQHRAAFREFFAGASKVIFPSAAARDRTRLHLGIDLSRTAVLPHGSDAVLTAQRAAAGERLRVAVVGQVAYPIKGADNYLQVLKASADLPLDWHFFGGTSHFGFEARVKEIGGQSVAFHGRYQRENIANLLAETGIDVVVLLPEAHETFSFVLSEAVTAGVAVICNKKGALPERVVEGKFGVVVDDPAGAAKALDELSRDRARLEALTAAARKFKNVSVADRARELKGLYESLGFLRMAEQNAPFNAAALQELAVRRVVPAAPPPPPPPAPVLTDAPPVPAGPPLPPRYQDSWWYPYFVRVKPLIPSAVRQQGRKGLERKKGVAETLHPLKKKNGVAHALHDLTIVRRGLRSMALDSRTTDPQIIFASRPFYSGDVRVVRFRLKHQSELATFAQFFWTHSADEGFCEVKSVRVPLEKANKWGTYEVRLDSPESKAAWESGAEIVHLRFDPISVQGPFEMSPVELLF
jgi:GT2 family glycosyltransferase/glycosyltransferase involved in cell wall biosynthesis/SAM-dependent methyltransferase